MKLTLALLIAVTAVAQTRTEEIEAARDVKTAVLAPDTPNKMEQRLIRFKDEKLMERFFSGYKGFKFVMGGMSAGSGFAAGTQYQKEGLGGGRFAFDTQAEVSTQGWTKFEAGLTSPREQRGLVFDLRAARRDYNSLPFYGGADSERDSRSNYRLEEATFDALVGFRLNRKVTVGGSGGYQNARIRQGQDARYASTDTTYPSLVGDFYGQTDFLRSGAFAQIDDRDNPGGPRSGRLYSVRFDDYRARDGRPYDFDRLDIDMQHYFPLYNKKRVIALRGRTVQTFAYSGNQVPFFHQPVLGGSEDLRGFRPMRFQDNNMTVMNAEYRWEVFSGMDMAVFGDAGRVSPNRWDFKLRELETAAGFGLRFNANNTPFLRMDVGFSHEGVQVFVRFNGIFRTRRLGSSSASHIL